MNLELARTEAQQKQGLSNRYSMANDTGLLFTFPKKDYYSFWNYQMKFPIDVLWIDDSIIVDKASFPIDNGQPITYTPKSPANYVLEVNAGLADKYEWSNGKSVILSGL